MFMAFPTALPMTEDDALTQAMRLDKKASSDSVQLPVPVRAGQVCVVTLQIDRLGELLDANR